ERVVFVNVGEEQDRDLMLRKLIDIQYARNDTLLGRGRFRVKGDMVEIQPSHSETAYRVSFFGDEVEQITHFDPLTGEVLSKLDHITVFPATQYVTSKPTIERALGEIRHELEEQVKVFESKGMMLEAHRIRQRTEYDLEMMRELGFCNGIENYSRILDGRPVGSAPHTLLDYFPSEYVVFVDESHQTVPQVGGMYEGDRARARHDADQEDVRGLDRLSARGGRQGALSPFRSRHARAHPDHSRAATRGVRRARRRQPAARGARPAGGVAGRDPRCGQGGLP